MKSIALRFQRPDRDKAWRLGCFAVAWFALAWIILDLRMMVIFHIPFWPDAGVYWRTWHGPMYGQTASLWFGTFIYSPAAALALWPLAQLPEAFFYLAWSVMGTAAYVWMLKPLPMASRVPAIAAGVLFTVNGNMEWLLALVCILGMRWPALWLVALFTKISPFVGFGWFVFRGEWRAVAWTAVYAVAIFAVSALILPGAWPKWIGMLGTLGNETTSTFSYSSLMPPVPFVIRGAAAFGLVIWGARKNKPFVLPLALALAQPDWQPWAFGILAAIPRLVTWPTAAEADAPGVARDSSQLLASAAD